MYENEGAEGENTSAVGGPPPVASATPPPLSGVARSRFFFSSRVVKGYTQGVGEGKGSDFRRIQSG